MPGRVFAAAAFCLLLIAATQAEEPSPEPAPDASPLPQVDNGREVGGGAPREVQVRPALARRKKNALSQFDNKRAPIDPRVFEARGRELQGQYYEIASTAKPATWGVAGSGDASSQADDGKREGKSRQWMIWTGAAGLAAIVGGSVGYLMLEVHTAPEPKTIHLDDKP